MNQARTPKGVPTGGEFAANTHDSATGALAESESKPILASDIRVGERLDLTNHIDRIIDEDIDLARVWEEWSGAEDQFVVVDTEVFRGERVISFRIPHYDETFSAEFEDDDIVGSHIAGESRAPKPGSSIWVPNVQADPTRSVNEARDFVATGKMMSPEGAVLTARAFVTGNESRTAIRNFANYGSADAGELDLDITMIEEQGGLNETDREQLRALRAFVREGRQ